MSKSPEQFHEDALHAVNALRLFVMSASRDDTEFELWEMEDGGIQIRFDAFQTRGRIGVDADQIAFDVEPKSQQAPGFRPCKLLLDRLCFPGSAVLNPELEIMAIDDGRHYAASLAAAFATSHPTSNIRPYDHEGAHLLMVAETATSRAASDAVSAMAQKINLALNNASCLVRYPILDVPGSAILIDDQDNVLNDSFADPAELRLLREAITRLPNVLQIDEVGDGDGHVYAIRPLAYTNAPATDRSLARIKAMAAQASAHAFAGRVPMSARYVADVPSAPRHSTNLESIYRAASAEFVAEWAEHSDGEPAPMIVERSIIDGGPDQSHFTVRLVMNVEPEAADRYNRSGRYRLQSV